MQSADELRERLIESQQTQIEVDEPEDDSMALLMGGEADKPAEDDMSEENPILTISSRHMIMVV